MFRSVLVNRGAQALAGVVALGAMTVTANADLVDDVNETLGLFRSEIVTLDIDNTPEQPVSIVVPLGGENFAVDFFPHSVRASGYRLIAQVEDGSYVDLEAGPIVTMRGTIAGVFDGNAAGSMLEGGLYARFRIGEELYWMEPLAGRIDGAKPNQYAVFHNQNVISSGGTCGTMAETLEEEYGNIHETDGDGGIAGNEICVAELACDADFEYFQDWGSVNGVENRINSIINFVNNQYEDEVFLSHTISAIIVRTSEPDPYSSTSPSGLLNQFQSHWLNSQGGIQRDVAHLFTGKNLQGSVIGIAWTIGSICSNFSSYCLSQSDCCGAFACATDLTAHELGHLWDANHCSCSSFTMNSGLTCSNTFHPTFTRPEIINYAATRTCLDCGGGGGDPEEAPLVSFNLVVGTLNSGGLPQAQNSDNQYINFSSVTQGVRNNTLAEFTADSDFTAASNVELRVEYGPANVSPVFTTIQVFNHNVGQFQGQSFTITSTTSDTTKIFNLGPEYMSNTGEVRIRFGQTAREPQTPNGFTSLVDHVEVIVTP